MPRSETEAVSSDTRLAVAAESLYLVNLLLLPGIAFGILVLILLISRNRVGNVARNHLRQTVAASIWAGVLLVIVSGASVLAGGFDQPATWVFVVLYFVTCHAALVLLGVIGLVKAMAGQVYRYPVIGPRVITQ